MRQTGNYLFLLVFLFISLVLMMSFHNIMLMKSLGLCLILGLCTSAYLITRRHRDQLILIPLGILALAVYLTMHATNEPTALKCLDKLLWLGFSGYLILIVFRQIFEAKSIKAQEIYGAISIYLLLGFMFTQIYEVILVIDPAAIAFDPKNFGGNVLQAGDVIYFSFITLATVGFGDVTPAIPVARAVCVIESIIGIMYVAIFIAKFVSIHSGRSGKQE
jgi:hypothetical protein